MSQPSKGGADKEDSSMGKTAQTGKVGGHTPGYCPEYVLTDCCDSCNRIQATAPETAAERDRLRESNAELSEALKASIPLIARGIVEGAYDNIVAGKGYAERVLQGLETLHAKAEGGA